MLKARRMSTTKFAKHFKNKEKSGNKFDISYMARVQRYLFVPQKSPMTRREKVGGGLLFVKKLTNFHESCFHNTPSICPLTS